MGRRRRPKALGSENARGCASVPNFMGTREVELFKSTERSAGVRACWALKAELRREEPSGAGMACGGRKTQSSRLRAREIDGSVVKSTY